MAGPSLHPRKAGRGALRPVDKEHSHVAAREWIASLASKDRQEREAARWALVSMGRPAIAPLLDCLNDKRDLVRWEAAKALADLEDPQTAPVLVKLLEDEESGIRWIAAEGLIALEHAALPPLLAALERAAHSQHLREGAHHVIRELHVWKLVDLLTPLMRALERPAADASVPVAASGVLDLLRRTEHSRARRPKV